jgi:hypothetical protein
MAAKPGANGKVVQSMIPKSGYRFSEKIMLQEEAGDAVLGQTFVERGQAARRYHLTLVLLYAKEQLPPRADRSPCSPTTTSKRASR